MSDESAHDWDFYPCRVDDAAASIFLDLSYGLRAPVAGADTLYAVAVSMRSPAEHGMGDRDELAALGPVEDQVQAWARERGLDYVGRLRNHGVWQLTLYGPSGAEEDLRHFAEAALRGTDRSFRLISKADPEWSYFREFLWPDRERAQWIADRRVVEALIAEGDLLDRPRRVDHWVFFASSADRDRFVDAARRLGFERAGSRDDGEGERPFGARVHRADAVALDAIHDVVMSLVDLADAHDGAYDGWETSVERPHPS